MQDESALSAKKKCIKEISARLKKARKEELNINQAQLAKVLGVEQSAVSKMESGGKQIDCVSLQILHNELGVDMNWLLTGDGQKKSEPAGEEGVSSAIADLQEWLQEISHEEPGRVQWLEMELRDKFPHFAEWIKKREQENAEIGNRWVA